MIKDKSTVRLRGKKIASTFSLFLALAYVYCLQNIYLCKCKWNSFDNPMSRVKRQNARLNSFLTEDSARFILLMYFQSEYFWATYFTLCYQFPDALRWRNRFQWQNLIVRPSLAGVISLLYQIYPRWNHASFKFHLLTRSHSRHCPNRPNLYYQQVMINTRWRRNTIVI